MFKLIRRNQKKHKKPTDCALKLFYYIGSYFTHSFQIKCDVNLTVRRCEPYTKYPSDFKLRGPHTKIDGKNGLSQTESAGIPLFNYIASGNITGYMGKLKRRLL